MKNQFLLNTLLTIVVFAALVVMMIVRICLPAAILPPLNIPNMVLLSLVALLLDYFLSPGALRCYVCVAVFSFLTFAILPLMGGFVCKHDFWLYGVVGCAVFTLTTWLFTSMSDRIATGPKAHFAILIGALGIFLASQCFMGILL